MFQLCLQVLFDELKLDRLLPRQQKIARTVAGNQLSTSECVLKQLTHLHPLPAIVMDYRQVLYITVVPINCIEFQSIESHAWFSTPILRL